MVKISIFIDTQLWIFALKIPLELDFEDKLEYKNYFQRYKNSNEFLKQQLSEEEICMTYYQLCELYHALGFRGKHLPLNFVQEYCLQLLKGEYMHWYQVNFEDIKQAMENSNQSGIHLWDYLCVLPLYRDVELIYTCDKHFTHKSFQSLGPSIKNPIDEWLIL